MDKMIEVTKDGAIFLLIDENSLSTYEKKGYKKVTVKKSSKKKSKTVEEAEK